jgi:hypothetical protein
MIPFDFLTQRITRLVNEVCLINKMRNSNDKKIYKNKSLFLF